MPQALNIYSLPRLLIFVLASSIGFFVLLKNTRSPVNRSFFLLTLSVSLWQFSYFILANTANPASTIFWSQLAYCGVAFITPTTYHFIASFLYSKNRNLVYLFYILSFAFIFVIFGFRGGLIFTGVRKFYWGYYPQARFTPHSIFLILWLIPFILSLLNLYKKYKEIDSPFNKKRIKYFLVTLPIAYLGIVDYLPNYGIETYPFGLIPVTLFIISTTYNIVRYRLLDIEIIVKKISLVTLGVIASISLIYMGTFYLGPYLSFLWGEGWIAIPVLVSVAVSLGLFRFINFVINIEEDELSHKFSYRPLLKKETQRIATVRNLKELLSYIARDLSCWVRLDYVGIFIWDAQKKGFVLARSLTRSKKRNKIRPGLIVEKDSPLILELLDKKRPLIYSQLRHELTSTDKRDYIVKVVSQMQGLGAEIVIPCFCEERLLALLNIGNKLNLDEIITNEDLELFSSLSNQAARAIYGFMLKEEKIQLIVASQNILIGAIEAKDLYTRGHTDRVALYSSLIGERLERQLRSFTNGLSDLKWSAQLHDVGKISIPDSILLKPGPLNREEWEKIKEHPLNGIRIIRPVQEWLGDDICAGILHHHENYDGSGYPDGQIEENIHFFARIIRVADAFDAMISDRPFSAALSRVDAIKELNKYKGVYFDPLVVETILELSNNGII